MGEHAVELVPPGARLLTHCNTGALATGGFGSALGAVRAAWDAGLVEHVWVDETRPLLQGARLTAWELEALGIPFAVIVDGAAASLMAAGRGRRRLHGRRPDRRERRRREQGRHLRARGRGGASRDPARRRRADVDARPERRDGRRTSRSRSATPPRSTARFPAHNPAFDVTPAELVSAIVTEVGVHRAPYDASLPNPVRAAMIAVDAETRATLERFGFDEELFEALRAKVAAGELSPESNVVRGELEPPTADDITPLPAPGAAGYDEARAGRHRRLCPAARSRRSFSRAAWRRGSAASSRRC